MSSAPVAPPGGLAGANSPFRAMSAGVSLSQSIAFTVVYALFAVVLFARLRRGVVHKVAYICFAAFAIFRVVTFSLRAAVSRTPPTSSHFLGVLMASGIVLVAGFLLLVEAVFFLNIDWHYAIRGRARDKLRKRLMLICHAVVVILTIIGIVGAVLMLVALQKTPMPDMKMFDTSKKLRIVSGALFLAFCTILMFLPVVISLQRPANSHIRRAPITALLVLFGACLILECIYRVWSSASISGFALTQNGIDVFLVLAEWLILLPMCVLVVDDMGQFHFWRGQRGGPKVSGGLNGVAHDDEEAKMERSDLTASRTKDSEHHLNPAVSKESRVHDRMDAR